MEIFLPDDVSRAKYILECDFPRLASVKEVAQRLGCNYNTLRAKFWRATGISMEGYLVRVRFAKAQALLMNSDTMVKQVARELGYNDEAIFVRQFKKHVGVTPGYYQNRKKLARLIGNTLCRAYQFL